MEIKQNTAHVTYVMLKDSTDNTEKTGISNPTVYYSKNGGASTQLASPSFIEVDATNIKGVYKLTFNTAMTDTVGELIVSVNATNCVQWVGKYVVVANVEADTKATVDNIKTQTDKLTFNVANKLAVQDPSVLPDNTSITAIKTKTDNLPSDPASNTVVNTRLAATDYVPSEINLTTEQVDQLAGALLDTPSDTHNLPGTVGQKINSAASAGDPLQNIVPGNYATGTAGHMLGSIAGNDIEFVSPVSQDGKIIMLNHGNDYFEADGSAIAFVDMASVWPDLAGAAVKFNCGTLTINVNVVTPSGEGKRIHLEISKEQIELIDIKYYDITATLANGHTRTLVEGKVVIE